jgi:hypothetical protein
MEFNRKDYERKSSTKQGRDMNYKTARGLDTNMNLLLVSKENNKQKMKYPRIVM